uniref:Uncharacterized protein n=1 Tax=Panagrolaimus sp. JU765 TaxID=591449 RepID=A0AC34PZ71_9BILA
MRKFEIRKKLQDLLSILQKKFCWIIFGVIFAVLAILFILWINNVIFVQNQQETSIIPGTDFPTTTTEYFTQTTQSPETTTITSENRQVVVGFILVPSRANDVYFKKMYDLASKLIEDVQQATLKFMNNRCESVVVKNREELMTVLQIRTSSQYFPDMKLFHKCTGEEQLVLVILPACRWFSYKETCKEAVNHLKTLHKFSIYADSSTEIIEEIIRQINKVLQ